MTERERHIRALDASIEVLEKQQAQTEETNGVLIIVVAVLAAMRLFDIVAIGVLT